MTAIVIIAVCKCRKSLFVILLKITEILPIEKWRNGKKVILIVMLIRTLNLTKRYELYTSEHSTGTYETRMLFDFTDLLNGSS